MLLLRPWRGTPAVPSTTSPARRRSRGRPAPAATSLHPRQPGHRSALHRRRRHHEDPTPQRASFQPERYGDRWAPVLISYVSPAEVPDIAAAVIAQAGPSGISATQRSSTDRLLGRSGTPVDVYVSGAVDIDAAQVAEALSHPGGQDLVRAVFEHELGHLVGLAHVEDPTQLMYPQTSTVVDYAAGDLTGLAALGTGPCLPEV